MITAAHRLLQVGGFSPLSLNPSLWLSDTGSNAAQWDDISGNGRHATQSTGISQPSIVTNVINGRQIRRFDGSNDFLATANASSSSTFTFFAVAKANQWNVSGSNYQLLATHGYEAGTNSTSGILFMGTAGAAVFDWQKNDGLIFGDGFNSTQNPRAIGALASGSDFRIVSTSPSRGWINGTRFTTRVENSGGAIDSFSRVISIGGVSSISGQYWSGDIAEIIIYQSALNDSQRQSVERYLSQKYTIAI
jgi:hypothetical protein